MNPSPAVATRARLSERGLLILLATVQFTHIMDFMIMMPLGPQLMRDLGISAGQFAVLIAAYTLSAGTVGLATAPFIDRFDRRRVLLTAYAGFAIGTLACALAQTSGQLMAARAVCGAFGGVSGATILAIVGDIIPGPRRGAAMGIIMTAFSAAAAIGVPFGLFLAQQFHWETPFMVIVAAAVVVWILLAFALPAVRGHLADGPPESWRNFGLLLRDANAWRGLALMASLVLGHFTIIPFLSPHLVFNLVLPENLLAIVYVIGGLLTVVTAPLIGRLSDRHGRSNVFTVVAIGAIAIILVLTQLGPTPIPATLALTGIFFIFASGRFVPVQAALTSAVNSPRRGAYMSLTACTRDFCAGLASLLAGWVVVSTPEGLLHVDWLGYLTAAVSLIGIWLIRRVRTVQDQPAVGAEPRPESRVEQTN